MKATSLSDTGKLRERNQDSVWVDAATGLCVLADGMGGHQAGEVASKLCVDTLRQALDRKDLDRSGTDAVATAVMNALNSANRVIRDQARSMSGKTNMGTTAAILVPWQHEARFAAVIAHVGDSRIYLWRKGHLKQLTRDHSLVQEQVGAGFLSKHEARQSHNRNLITRALGLEETVEPEFDVVDIEAGDLFLLCSDGLNTMVGDDEISEILSALGDNPALAARALIAVANDFGGHDNVTVALAWTAPAPSAHQAPSKSLFSRLFGWLFGK
jgi:protein phosphatase